MIRFTGQTDHSYDWDEIDKMLRPHGEQFVLKTAPLAERGQEERTCWLLSTGALYQVEQQYRRTALTLLHSVVEDPVDSCALVLLVYSTAKVRALLGAVGVGGLGSFDALVVRRHLTCGSPEECFRVMEAIRLMLRRLWQQIFESTVVRVPETYQSHDHVIKVNRKLRGQDRILVVSDRWLYNVEPDRDDSGTRVTSASLRWAVPLLAVKAVTLTRSRGEADVGPSVSLFFDLAAVRAASTGGAGGDHIGSKGDDLNDMHTFSFRTVGERDRCAAEMARAYYTASLEAGRGGPEGHRLPVDARDDVAAAEAARRRSSVAAAVEIEGTLVKFTGGGTGSHPKFVRLLRGECTIEWRDSLSDSKKKDARVVACFPGVTDLKGHKVQPSAEETARMFTVQTSEKTLLFLALTADEARRWVDAARRLLGQAVATAGAKH